MYLKNEIISNIGISHTKQTMVNIQIELSGNTKINETPQITIFARATSTHVLERERNFVQKK